MNIGSSTDFEGFSPM